LAFGTILLRMKLKHISFWHRENEIYTNTYTNSSNWLVDIEREYLPKLRI
jgi:hypothetical protein